MYYLSPEDIKCVIRSCNLIKNIDKTVANKKWKTK